MKKKKHEKVRLSEFVSLKLPKMTGLKMVLSQRGNGQDYIVLSTTEPRDRQLYVTSTYRASPADRKYEVLSITATVLKSRILNTTLLVKMEKLNPEEVNVPAVTEKLDKWSRIINICYKMNVNSEWATLLRIEMPSVSFGIILGYERKSSQSFKPSKSWS